MAMINQCSSIMVVESVLQMWVEVNSMHKWTGKMCCSTDADVYRRLFDYTVV